MTLSDAPKRFYKQVSVAEATEGWTVTLDERPIRTPGRALLALPQKALAERIAQEWDQQSEKLDLASMTFTRLANVAIDRTPAARSEMVAEIARYAETDVTCYLSDTTGELRQRQEAAWRPWRDWAGKALNVVLVPVEGIIAAPQPEASLQAVRDYASASDDFRLTSLAWSTSLFGSAVLALAVDQQELDAREALRLSCIDEDWQAEQWGDDDEAARVRAMRARDAAALGDWTRALSA